MPLTPELFDQIDAEVQKRKQAGQWTPEYESAYGAVRAKAIRQFPTHFAQQSPPATPASFTPAQEEARFTRRAEIQAMSPQQRNDLRVENLDNSRFGTLDEKLTENQARLFRDMNPVARAIGSGVAQSAGSTIGLAARGLEAIGVNDPGTTDEFNRMMNRVGQGQAQAGAGKVEQVFTGAARVATDVFTGGRLTRVLGGGSSTFLGVQSAQVANEAFTQGKDSGLSDTAATNFALREGGSNFLFSMIAGKVLGQGFESMAPAAKQAFKQSFTETAKRKGLDFGKMFAQELPEEISQNIGSAFNKTYSGMQDKPYESLDAFWEEQFTTAAVTALVAGARTAMPSLPTGPQGTPEAPFTAEITMGPGNLADRNLQTARPEAPPVQDESRLLPAPTRGQVIGDNSQGLLGPAEPAQVTDNTAGKTGFFVSPRGTAVAADIDPTDRQRALDIVDGPAGPGSFTQQQQESQVVTDELETKAQQVTERQKNLQDRLGKFGITVGEPEQATSMKIGTRTFKTELSPAEIDDHSALISPREDITDADEIDADITVQRGNREAVLKRPDDNFVMVDLPVAAFEPRNAGEGLAKGEKYKAQSGDTAPPIVAGIPAADDKGRLVTTDGDTRLKAALLRGDKTIKAYVPKGDVEELKQRLAAKRAKQGPPKVKADAPAEVEAASPDETAAKAAFADEVPGIQFTEPKSLVSRTIATVFKALGARPVFFTGGTVGRTRTLGGVYRQWANVVFIRHDRGNKDIHTTAGHEIGHWIENNHPEVAKTLKEIHAKQVGKLTQETAGKGLYSDASDHPREGFANFIMKVVGDANRRRGLTTGDFSRAQAAADEPGDSHQHRRARAYLEAARYLRDQLGPQSKQDQEANRPAPAVPNPPSSPKAKAIQTQIDELTQQAAEQRRLGRLLPARRLDQAVTRAIKERDAIMREDNRAEAETSIAKVEARDTKLAAEQKAKDVKFAADQAEKDQFVSEQVKKAADARKQAQPDSPSTGSSRPKPNKVVQKQAARYMESVGIEAPTGDPVYAKVNPLRASRIAKAYEKMPHNPSDPRVQASYRALKDETLAQYEALEAQGVTFEYVDSNPYASSQEAAADIRDNKTLKVLRTSAAFGSEQQDSDNVMLERVKGSSVKDLTYNDVFRAVHDYYGHAAQGYGFGPRGEENAWRSHSQMYSDVARPAMTTETRGQNSWVNYGPRGEQNRANPAGTVYAEQKMGLLPEEFWSADGLRPVDPAALNAAGDAIRTRTLAEGTAPSPKTQRFENIRNLKETGKTGNDNPQPQAPASTSVTGRGVATVAAQTEPRFSIDSMGDHVKDWLSAAGTYNRPAEWVDRKRAAKAGDTIARERAIQWTKRWGKQMESAGLVFSDATTAQALWQTLRGNADMKQWSPAVQDLLNNWRKTQDRFSREAADAYRAAGMDEMAQAYEDNIGTYVKSVPKWTLTAVGRVGRAIKTWRESLNLTPSFGKFRRDAWTVVDGRGKVVQKFADEASAKTFQHENAEGKAWKVLAPRTDAERAVEDVLDPRYNLIAGTGEAAHNASMVNLHTWVATNLAQKPPKGLKGDALESWAKAQELVRLPNQGKFHKLHDVYVPGTVASDLTDMVDMPSGIMAVMGSYLNVWKASKTVWNISSHFVNTMSNAVGFAHLAGISLANPANWKHYASGFNALIEKGAKWEEMVKAGAIGGEYYGNEVALIKRAAMDMADGPGGMFATVAKVFRKTGAALGKAYNFEDAIFKAAAYSKYRSQGMDAKQASDEVNQWFPNYDRTSRLAQLWSRNPVIGTPFASFTDQAIRITGRAAKDRPIKLMAMLAAPAMIYAIGKMLAGSTEEEERVVRANQGFIERYFTPTIGRDSNGSLLTLDLRRLVPLANDLAVGQQDHGAITTTLFANGPFVRTLIEQMAGKDMFTGRDIVTAGDRAKNLAKNLLPIPSWLQHGPQRIAKSLDTKDSKREDRALAIIGTVVGINVRTPYMAEQKVKASIARAWADDDNDLATSMMEVWNDKYRPDDLERIKQSDIVKQAEKLNETAYRVLSVNGREVGKFDTKDDAQNWIDESPERRRSRIVAPPK